MKNIKIYLIAATFFFLTAGFKEHSGFQISGAVRGMQKGYVYLEHVTKDKSEIDSTQLINGKFTFTGVVPETMLYSIYLKAQSQQIAFFVGNSEISVSFHKDSLFAAKVVGSPETQVYNDFYRRAWIPVTEKAGKIYRKSDSLEKAGIKDSLTKKAIAAEFKQLDAYNIQVVTQFVKAHRSSIAAACVIYDRFISYPNFAVASELYALLAPEVKKSLYAKHILSAVDLSNSTSVGKTAPDFSMATPDGNTIKLSKFKGKYVLVDFWASWCGPCRAENPNVVKAYGLYHDKGFEILGVSLDTKQDLWIKAIKADNLAWSHVSDLKGWANSAAALYGVKSVPTNFLIDAEGKIVARDLRGADLDRELQRIFNKS